MDKYDVILSSRQRSLELQYVVWSSCYSKSYSISTSTVCSLKKYSNDTSVHTENVINIKDRCNVRAEWCTTPHSVQVFWQTLSPRKGFIRKYEKSMKMLFLSTYKTKQTTKQTKKLKTKQTNEQKTEKTLHQRLKRSYNRVNISKSAIMHLATIA